MKRTILVFVLCSLLLCFAACGNAGTPAVENNPRFNSNEEMLQFMEGMWVAEDDTEEKNYYVFQDNQICIITDALYSAAVEKLLDSALQNGGLDVLSKQDFETVAKRMYLSDISFVPEPIMLYPKSGEIKLNKGKSDEETIAIINDTVFLKNTATETGVTMKKLSDTTDFSIKAFQPLFDTVKDACEVPAGYILMPTEEYGEMVKTMLTDFSPTIWRETRPDENSIVYETIPEWFAVGKLLISNKEIDLKYAATYDTKYFNAATSTFEKISTLKIYYQPERPSVGTMQSSSTKINITSLMQYCLYAVKDYPGVYKDSAALYADMKAHGETKISTYDISTTLKLNGVEYWLTEGPSGTSATFVIQIHDTIPLKQALDIVGKDKNVEENKNTETNTPANDNIEPTTTPTQSGTLEQLLDGSKSWVGEWEHDGWLYNVFFVFKEDGTCYFALGDMELFGAGKGTYTVKDNKTISLDLKMNGEKSSATYTFDPDTFSLTVASAKGIVAKKGDVFYLQENTNQDVEIIKGWADSYADGMPESSTWE